MDVVTDFLVVSFPIALLWRVRISVRQKIGLGILLSLSLVMAVIAITRMSGIKLADGAPDIVWLAFWQQQECSIAVIMISVSAFRSLFVTNSSTRPEQKRAISLSYWRKRLLRKRARPELDDEERCYRLPPIPSATLTGVRTMIMEARISTVWPSEREAEGMVTQSGVQGNEADGQSEKNPGLEHVVVDQQGVAAV